MNQIALLLALPLAMAAAPPPPVASATKLEGTTWHFTAIDGKEPVGLETSLTFYKGRIGANVGCNGMGADMKILGSKLIAGPVMSTMMYCDGVMDQERAVGALLAAKPVIMRRGTLLTLTGGGHSAELHLED